MTVLPMTAGRPHLTEQLLCLYTRKSQNPQTATTKGKMKGQALEGLEAQVVKDFSADL